MTKTLLKVENLKLYYPIKLKSKNVLKSKKANVKAVNNISFEVKKGETFGIVGESGCGKTTLGHVLVRLLKPTEGKVYFEGEDIFDPSSEISWAKKIQIIFQDPFSSLDPRFTVGRSIAEPIVIQENYNAKQRKERVLDLMRNVGLSEEHYTKFPHEFSGGQRQRIGVARALALNPELIICDEPVSALDVSIQGQILNLMEELQKKLNLTYIFISHDLSVVNHICDRVAVMYLGNIVEIANRDDLFNKPLHPYTKALLSAIPIADPEIESMKGVLKGDVPSPLFPPEGCCFHTRCNSVMEKCKEIKPNLKSMGNGHCVACHLFENINEEGN